MSTFVTATELADLDPDKRVNYTLGMIIGADDLRQDQRYLTARDETHQRSLHGWGVLSGLSVDIDPELRLRVTPGTAIDGEGRTICVDRTQCADLLGWLNDHDDAAAGPVEVWVLLCHATCETDLLPVPSGPCQSLDDSLAPSRVVDSFRLELSLEAPVDRQDRAHPAFGAAMTQLVADATDEADRRAVLRQFVADRGVDPAWAGPCLSAAGDPCVPIGTVVVELAADGDALVYVDDPTDDDVDTTFRPIMLSTTFLQEWLLRVDGGGVVDVTPDLGVLDLNDATTPGDPPDAPDTPDPGAVLRYDDDDDLWIAAPLRLSHLDDVDDTDPPHGNDLYLGYHDGRWRPRPVVHPDVVIPDVPEVDGDFVHARVDSMIGIVASGVLELDLADVDDSGAGQQLTGRFRTEYGGLELVDAVGASNHGLFRVRFQGIEEAVGAYFELDGRQFVVKATAEHTERLASVQVVRVDDQGVVFRFSAQRLPQLDAITQRLLPGFEVDPSHVTTAFHLEFSVFDDKEAEPEDGIVIDTEHREAAPSLWEPTA